jgi:probable rRNA maturation factor
VLYVEVSYAARRPWVPRRSDFSLWASGAWAAAGMRCERALVEIRVVGGVTARRLNARYRQRDYATNVLSFAGAGAGPAGWHLGELVICAPVMAAETCRLAPRSAAGSLRVRRPETGGRRSRNGAVALHVRRSHWAHIVVHGVLHLAGFDHERPAAARKMEALEVQILDRLGFSDPYA